MMRNLPVAVLVASLLFCLTTSVAGVPLYEECRSSEDCGPGACCVLGMMRYSVPTCRKLGGLGDYCRRYNQSMNRTLSYPNEIEIKVTNVYLQMCPCASVFRCESWHRTCVDDITNDITNDI